MKPIKDFAFKNSLTIFIYLLIVWGFYRSAIQLPQAVEEVALKPILWLFPVFYFVRKEGRGLSSLGITSRNLLPALLFSLGLGLIFILEGLIINYFKYQGFNFGANIGQLPLVVSLAISFVTAFSEEITFRGYIFSRLWEASGSEINANLLTSAFWILIHIPIAVFLFELALAQIILYLVLAGIFSLGAGFIFARTRNVFGTILLHVLWQWPIILFR